MRITSDLFHLEGIAFDFEEDIKVTIELNKRERRKFEDFFIFAKHRGKWISVKTTYEIKTGILTFSIRRMDTFFAYSQQKVTKLNLTQKGAKFVADDDPNVHVNFPQDAVDGTRDLSIRVLDIDKGLQETMAAYPDLFGITYMSPCIFVDHDMKDKLKCPARVQVPFLPENIPEDQEFVIFHWGKNNVTIEPAAASFGQGLCTLDTDEFSGKSTGLVKKNGISDVALDIHTKMYKGQLKLCKILTFRDPADRTSLYIDCCQLIEMNKRVSDLEEKGLREIPHSRSKDLYLIEAEKIKIQLKGCITYVAEVPKTYYCITYLSTCSDVHTNFPVKPAKKAGADPHAILIFETHGARAQTQHVVHYDPDRFDNITVRLGPNPADVPHRKTKTGPPGTRNKEKLTEKLGTQQMRDAKKNPINKISEKDEVEENKSSEDDTGKTSDAI
ncbi:hypothetical protein ACJMK2_038551 [Sinanodonta woodiana]|uniref:Uncharacterized protein n=1 Tax=Sinanodonta woodiana TaxID=1069815 RepID=A0ABD3WA67_SINWO